MVKALSRGGRTCGQSDSPRLRDEGELGVETDDGSTALGEGVEYPPPREACRSGQRLKEWGSQPGDDSDQLEPQHP
jgi:hypothetical protein